MSPSINSGNPGQVISHPTQLYGLGIGNDQLDITQVERRDVHLSRTLFIDPKFFEASYESNAHAQVGSVNKSRAKKQHKKLVDTYRQLGLNPEIISAPNDLPDAVFTANQSFPFLDRQGQPKVLMSKMFNPERRKEVEAFRYWYQKEGYGIERLPGEVNFFEGMGDALWLQGRNLLLGGYGFRSELGAYSTIAQLTGAHIFAFDLRNPYFYHLDTCLSVLNETTAMVHMNAFTFEGQQLLRFIFPNLIEVNEREAIEGFACNAHCPDGEHVIIQKGNHKAVSALVDAGFSVIELDTSEFMKAGGSVFCMKMMLPI